MTLGRGFRAPFFVSDYYFTDVPLPSTAAMFSACLEADFENRGTVAGRNTCSIALPVVSTSESVFSAPITEMPSGKPLTTPIGRVRCGYPAIAARYPAPTQAGHTSPLIRSIGGANGPEGATSTSTLALLSSWSIPFCPLAAMIASIASLCGAEPAAGRFVADTKYSWSNSAARSPGPKSINFQRVDRQPVCTSRKNH